MRCRLSFMMRASAGFHSLVHLDQTTMLGLTRYDTVLQESMLESWRHVAQ